MYLPETASAASHSFSLWIYKLCVCVGVFIKARVIYEIHGTLLCQARGRARIKPHYFAIFDKAFDYFALAFSLDVALRPVYCALDSRSNCDRWYFYIFLTGCEWVNIGVKDFIHILYWKKGLLAV